MKEFHIEGRLGNQLFQFARIYSEVFSNGGEPYTIDVCPVDTKRLKYKPTIGQSANFTGYWESEQFFDKELIRKIYSPTATQVKKIHAKYGDLSNTLFISVRRGDFVRHKRNFVCVNAQYYTDMYNMLTANKKYDKVLLTSDDIRWCKDNVYIPQEITYVEETPFDTIMIGSQCKDFIIGSSTFAWWCAWLGEVNGGEIVCPTEHFYGGYLAYESSIFFPKRWHQVDASKYYEGAEMKVLLCGIAKMENHYLREWVEWYKNIGVDHIVLYDNNDVDGERFEEVIGDYIEHKFVEVVDYRGRKQSQHEAYADCYARYRKEYDWLMFFDIDELLRIEKKPFGKMVKPFLSQRIFNAYNGVKICWKCMTDGGMLRVENGDYSMFDRFKDVLDINNKHNKYCKTVVRGGLRNIYWKSAHHPEGLGSVCDVYGRPSPNKNRFDRPIWEKAVLRHYKFKTVEEYVLNKMRRLYPDHSDEYSKAHLSMDFFYTINERTPEKDALAAELQKTL